MRSILTCLAAASLAAAADDPTEVPDVDLPSAVERALERRERARAEAAEEYREELAEADERALRILEREKERATRAGNLDLALALRARIEELQAAAAPTDFLGRPVDAEAPPEEAGGGAEAPARKGVAGSWDVFWLGNKLGRWELDGEGGGRSDKGGRLRWKQTDRGDLRIHDLGTGMVFACEVEDPDLIVGTLEEVDENSPLRGFVGQKVRMVRAVEEEDE